MARGRKAGPTRMDLRRQAEAAEAKDKEKDEDEEEEEVEESDDDGGDDDDEKPKKAKAKAKKKAPAKPKAPSKRTRTPKEVRQRAIWVVFDNASKRVETFPFPQKAEAEEFLAKKLEDKKTFYLSLVKEPLVEG